MNLQKFVEDRFGSCKRVDVAEFYIKKLEGREGAFNIETFEFERESEGHPKVFRCYAWLDLDGVPIILLHEGEVNSAGSALQAHLLEEQNKLDDLLLG